MVKPFASDSGNTVVSDAYMLYQKKVKYERRLWGEAGIMAMKFTQIKTEYREISTNADCSKPHTVLVLSSSCYTAVTVWAE